MMVPKRLMGTHKHKEKDAQRETEKHTQKHKGRNINTNAPVTYGNTKAQRSKRYKQNETEIQIERRQHDCTAGRQEI